MNDSIIRYQYNPMLTDTVGFYDYCIPITNERSHPAADSLVKYYDFSVYNFITPPPASRHLDQTISIFKPHNLEPIHTGPLSIDHQSFDWITLVFIACLFVLAWIQTSQSKRLSQIFHAVFLPHYVNQLEREGNLFKERISLGLGFIYYSISSIFVFLIVREYSIVPPGWSNMAFTGIIFAGLFFFQNLKSAAVNFSGIIFDTREIARLYHLNTLIFNNMIGLVLFPLVVIATYWSSSIVIITGIILVLLLLIYRLFRGFLTGMDNKSYNLFYLFLYLCTLEILPLLLLYKVISKI